MKVLNMISRRTLVSIAACAILAPAAALAEDTPKRVAIANYGEHPSLAATIAGFKKGLAKEGFVEGKTVRFTESHTNFSASLVPQMIAKLLADKPDVMFSLTTPVSQIAKKQLSSTTVPLVFGAITDPVAAKLVSSWTSGEDKVTGSSDFQSPKAIVAMARRLVPEAKVLGMPYSPGEANDVAFSQQLKKVVEAEGMTLLLVGVDSTNDIGPRMASFKGKADVIYNSTSSLLQPAVAAVAAACKHLQLPLINADDAAVRSGLATASASVSYDSVGFEAGVMAGKILKGASPRSLPPSKPALEQHALLISKKAMADVKLEPTAAVKDCRCYVD